MGSKTLVNLAFGIAVSAAVLYGFWRWLGAFGLVYGIGAMKFRQWLETQVLGPARKRLERGMPVYRR